MMNSGARFCTYRGTFKLIVIYTNKQSKPFPCAPDNQIMVGLTLNVPLLSSCKHADVNVFNVTPTVSIIGLTGSHTSVSGLVLTGSSPFGGVLASWNKTTGTISMMPLAETVAGQVYYFSFMVTNKAEGQAAPTLSMRTDTILDALGQVPVVTPDAYTSWASAHHSSGAFLAEEEVKAMFIRSPGLYRNTSVQQTTSHPCADNNLTVTLEINVPLYAACRTNFTIMGLINTVTADNFAGGVSISAQTHPPALTALSWARDTGTIVVSNDGADVSQNADGRNTLVFTFMVENPAVGQEAPELTIRASTNGNFTTDAYAWEYDTPARGGAWTNGLPQTTHGAVYDFHPLYEWKSQDGTSTFTGYPTTNQYLHNNSQWLSYSTTGIAIEEPSTQNAYPLYVQSPKLAYSLAGQSSPWPCDDNTITLLVQANVPFLARCNPVVTVTGLEKVKSPPDGSMSVYFWGNERMDHIPADARNAIGSNVTADWTRSAGSLTFNLTQILIADASTTQQQSGGQDVLQFTFEVVNRHDNYGSGGDLQVQYSLTSRGDLSDTTLSGPVFSEQHAVGTNAWHVHTGPATLFAEERATIYMDQAEIIAAGQYIANYSHTLHEFKQTEATNDLWVQVAPNDGKPLHLKTPTFSFTEIRQSSSYPCDDNNIITVSLRSSVPLLTKHCEQNITISGLNNFVNVNNETTINEGGHGILTSVFKPLGTWDRDAGTFLVSVNSTMIAGELYVLAFKLHNPVQANTNTSGFQPLRVVASPNMNGESEIFNGSGYAVKQDTTLTHTDAYQYHNSTANDLWPQYIREISYEMKMVNQR